MGLKSFNQDREEFKSSIIERLAEIGIETQPCRSCGEPLIFLKTHKGKWQPVDMYLESHFANCPYAEKFRK